jgi:hypothetical protein
MSKHFANKRATTSAPEKALGRHPKEMQIPVLEEAGWIQDWKKNIKEEIHKPIEIR